MNGNSIAKKLRSLQGYTVVFTPHAELRLRQRQIDKCLVVGHLRKPSSLKLCEKLKTAKGREKYKLWFVPHTRIAYIYIIVINHSQQRITVRTAIKQRLAWQRKVQKYAG